MLKEIKHSIDKWNRTQDNYVVVVLSVPFETLFLSLDM